MIKQGWSFYGRRDELGQLRRVLDRGRWFFVNVSGRRRIGKTALVQQALQPAQRARVLYLQTPDADPAGVVSAARDFFQTFGITDKLPVDLRSLATRIGALCASGWTVAVDEEGRRLRLGSCKRSAPRLISDLRRFDGHVARFVQAFPRYAGWTVEKLAVAPTLSPAQRAACVDLGYIPQDLGDLTAGLRP